MKLVFLGTSSAIVWCMRRHRIIKLTYDRDQDTFRYVLLVLPCFVLAGLTAASYKPLEVSERELSGRLWRAWCVCV
jgi:ER lumen protein retaining receptor